MHLFGLFDWLISDWMEAQIDLLGNSLTQMDFAFINSFSMHIQQMPNAHTGVVVGLGMEVDLRRDLQ